MRYIRLLGIEYRNLRYIQPNLDLSLDLRHKTLSAKSSAFYLVSAIYLLLVEVHPNPLNRILLGFVFSKILWVNVPISQGGYPLPTTVSSGLQLLHLSSAWYLFL